LLDVDVLFLDLTILSLVSVVFSYFYSFNYVAEASNTTYKIV